jgi:chromosome segregation ATPase
MRKAEEREESILSALNCAKAEAAAVQSRLSGMEKWSVELGRKLDGLSRAFERSLALAEGRPSQEERMASAQALNALSLNFGLLEGRLKNLEAGLEEDLKRRFSAVDAMVGDSSRKAGLAAEMGASVARRADKLDASVSRLSSMEQRLSESEKRLGSLYELEALAQSLKLSVSGMETNFDAAMRSCSQTAAGNKKLASDFEALSRQVMQLSALFNQLRTELAFLLGRSGGGIGG